MITVVSGSTEKAVSSGCGIGGKGITRASHEKTAK